MRFTLRGNDVSLPIFTSSAMHSLNYKSRAHRDKVNAKVMKDKRLASMMAPKDMPFDTKRMLYGGFKVLVDAWRSASPPGGGDEVAGEGP